MASFVNAADAIAAAVEIEKRGHGFYIAVRDKSEATADRDFFAFMASEELRHEKIFEAMLTRVGGLDLPAGSSDAEYLEYVRDLLDTHCLFTDSLQEQVLRSPFEEAIRFEKDTLLFFLELENMVPDSERKYVRQCADEERKHIKMLIARKAGRVK